MRYKTEKIILVWAIITLLILILFNYSFARKNDEKTCLKKFLDNNVIESIENGDQLDQYQHEYYEDPPGYVNGWAVFEKQWMAQSFKPTLPILTRVKLWIWKEGNPSADIIVSIRDSLYGDDIVSVSLSSDKISEYARWVEFDFPNISVNIEHKYYIVCRSYGGDKENCYAWVFGKNTDYDRGEEWYTLNKGYNWYADYNEDMCFETYGTSYKTIYVDDDGGKDFTKIQDAINFANDGDTIFIYNGTYYENVIVDKFVNLIGESKENVIVDGKELKEVIFFSPGIDQCHTKTYGYFAILDNVNYAMFAQSFIPSKNTLDRVKLLLTKSGNPKSFIVSIRKSLEGEDLISVSVNADKLIELVPIWIECDFPDINVIPGKQYFIVLKSLEADLNNFIGWFGEGGVDFYTKGEAWFYDIEWYNATSIGYPNWDFCFKTYGKIYPISKGINFTGFKIKNSGDGWYDSALTVEEKIIITDCIITCNSIGIYTDASYILIKRCIINNNTIGILEEYSQYTNISYCIVRDSPLNGIYLKLSNQNNIYNCIIEKNYYGILFRTSPNNFIKKNKILNNIFSGIDLSLSPSCTISNNTISKNLGYGFYAEYSPHCSILSNEFIEDGIILFGGEINDYIHTIQNNKVNGKSIYYFKNKHHLSIPSDAGECIFVGCSNINGNSLNFSNSDSGLIFAYCSEVKIINSIFDEMNHAICIFNSSDCRILENVFNSGKSGIIVFGDGENKISKNVLKSCNVGIEILSSNKNQISMNGCFNNNFGISVDYYSEENLVDGNNCSNCVEGIHMEYHSKNNTISNNFFSYNFYGIHLCNRTDNNIIRYNVFSYNEYNGILLENAWNNKVIHNQIGPHNCIGLMMLYSRLNIIKYNDIKNNNYCGVGYMLHSRNNHLNFNNICGNEYGVLAGPGCYENARHNWWGSKMGPSLFIKTPNRGDLILYYPVVSRIKFWPFEREPIENEHKTEDTIGSRYPNIFIDLSDGLYVFNRKVISLWNIYFIHFNNVYQIIKEKYRALNNFSQMYETKNKLNNFIFIMRGTKNEKRSLHIHDNLISFYLKT